MFAGPIITLVFGPQYAQSVGVFRILVWMIPIALVSGHYRYALIAYGLQKYEFYCALVGAAASIGAGVPLVLTIGIQGAAMALVCSSWRRRCCWPIARSAGFRSPGTWCSRSSPAS